MLAFLPTGSQSLLLAPCALNLFSFCACSPWEEVLSRQSGRSLPVGIASWPKVLDFAVDHGIASGGGG